MRIGVPPWKKASATRFTLSQIEQHREKCVATSYAHVPASWTSDCIALLLIERHLISVRHSGLLIEKHLRVWCKTLIHTDGSYSCKAQRARGRPTPQQQATLLFFILFCIRCRLQRRQPQSANGCDGSPTSSIIRSIANLTEERREKRKGCVEIRVRTFQGR